MSANNELLNKLKEFLTEEEIQQGIEKGVIKIDIEKGIDDKTMQRMPLDHKGTGLDSGTGPVVESTAPGASWEMVKTTIMKAMDAMEKAKHDMSEYMDKAMYQEEKDKEMEKAYGKMMSSADEMKKQMKMYKGKNNMMKANMMGQGSAQVGQGSAQVGQGMQKSEDKESLDRIEKAFNDKISSVTEKNDQLEQTNKQLVDQNANLQKSMESMTDTLTKLQGDIQKIGQETPAPKAVNYQAYIEKGGVKDEDGKKIYHVSMHKHQIIDELEKAKVYADDIQKAKLDEDILNFAGAGMAPSEASSRLLYDKSNVKLVK